MKIAHIADVHIRGNQYLDEMEHTFKELLSSCVEKKCELLVIAGDLYHSKLTVTNEYFEICRRFLKSFLNEGIKVLIIPGNHDLALNNTDRLDAITPVYNSLKELHPNEIFYEKASGLILQIENFNFWHMSCLDNKNKWPTKADTEKHKSKVNVALYHGSINNSMVDSGWVSRGNKDEMSIFEGFDFGFLGDIHMHQFLSPTVAYPGSLRQNDYGESADKGYIFWSISSKSNFQSEHVVLNQKRYFVTIEVDSLASLKTAKIDIPKGCRIRIKPQNKFSPAEEALIKEYVKLKFKPMNDPSVLPIKDEEEDFSLHLEDGTVIEIDENIRKEEVQKKLIKEYLFTQGVEDEDFVKEVYELDKVYHSYIEFAPRGIIWKPKKFEWSNFFSYGEKNSIDFSKAKGVVGIFGSNGSGKSSICDTFCFGLTNKINKENANKNGLYVNVRKSEASVKHCIESENKTWTVERKITNKKTKSNEIKTTNNVSFYSSKSSKKKNQNEEDIVQTNAEIQRTFGTNEDLVMTSIVTQFGLTNLIDAKKTERKKIYAKFFDLDIFDKKFSLANEDFKKLKAAVEVFENRNLTEEINEAKKNLEDQTEKLKDLEDRQFKQNEFMERIISEYSKINLKPNVVTQSSIDSLKSKIEQGREKIKKIESEIDFLLPDNVENLAHHLKTNEQDVKKIKDLEKEKLFLAKKLVVLKEIPGEEICQSCSLVKDAYESKPQLQKIEKEIETLSKRLMSKEDVFKIDEKIKKIKENNSKLEELSLLQSSVEMEESALSSLTKAFSGNKSEEELKQKAEKIEKIKKELAEKISKTASEIFEVAKNQGRYEELIKNLEGENKKREELLKKFHVYQMYMKSMGKDGIAYMILSKRIPAIENEVNKILSQIVSYKFKIENDQKEKSINYYIVETDKGTRQAELASGGEKTIISIALRAALWKHCQLPKPNILFLDEPFGFLDVEKYDLMINLLEYLKSYFSTIFVISHNEDIKTSMDSIIYVKTDDQKYSYVSVG